MVFNQGPISWGIGRPSGGDTGSAFLLAVVLTPAEQQLTKSADGMELIKKVRSTLVQTGKPILFQVISDITGEKVLDLQTDISTATGERVFVFTLDSNLENTLPRKKTS